MVVEGVRLPGRVGDAVVPPNPQRPLLSWAPAVPPPPRPPFPFISSPSPCPALLSPHSPQCTWGLLHPPPSPSPHRSLAPACNPMRHAPLPRIPPSSAPACAVHPQAMSPRHEPPSPDPMAHPPTTAHGSPPWLCTTPPPGARPPLNPPPPPPPTATQDGATPLFIAAQNSHLEVVRLLVASGAKVDAARQVRGALWVGRWGPVAAALVRGGHPRTMAGCPALGAVPRFPLPLPNRCPPPPQHHTNKDMPLRCCQPGGCSSCAVWLPVPFGPLRAICRTAKPALREGQCRLGRALWVGHLLGGRWLRPW